MRGGLLVVLLIGLGMMPGHAREPNAEELARIETALRASGFTAWGSIEFDEVWEVEAARRGSQKCDVDLNPETFQITAEDCE